VVEVSITVVLELTVLTEVLEEAGAEQVRLLAEVLLLRVRVMLEAEVYLLAVETPVAVAVVQEALAELLQLLQLVQVVRVALV
jgi:hypothetical protein